MDKVKHGPDFVLQCSCGRVLSFETNKHGRLSKAGQTLAGLFRHFHEKHGGTVGSPDNSQPRPSLRQTAEIDPEQTHGN